MVRADTRHDRGRRFARNEVVFHEGDPGDTLHLPATGHLAVRVATPLGDVATITVLGPGEVFGELALVTGRHRTATVVALEPATTLALSRSQFDALREASPDLDRFLIDLLAADVGRLSEQLLEALYVPVEKRVIRRLVRLTGQYGEGAAGTVIPLTQEDLASMAGTTRPTTNRVLREAEAAGAIRVGRGRVEILDPGRLAGAAR